MEPLISLTRHGAAAILQVDAPPVNALGAAVRRGIADHLAQAAADPAISAVVLICGGRTFFAGADISEIGKPFAHPDLSELVDLLDAFPKLVIAAIHGSALGGGLELALACNYRIAVPAAKFGLPEVALGILPGAGGTQRLPRLTGAAFALEFITSGKPIAASQALERGIIDRLADDSSLTENALAYAHGLIAAAAPRLRASAREDKIAADRNAPALFSVFRTAHIQAFKGLKAPDMIVSAIEAAVHLPFRQGLARERALFLELMASTESRALRHVFFAERVTAKIPDISAATPTQPIAQVGIIGAGTMGGGIAMNFANAGIPITLLDASPEGLERGLSVIRRNYEATARKGRITAADVTARMALIQGTLDFNALAAADLTIEAVFESMPLKQQIFAQLSAVAKPGAILASNTSFLDLDAIAAVTAAPEQVIGLHFFSPANVMRLLEVVRGARSSPAVIATAMQLAKKIGKIPVLSRVCHGFIANRAMNARARQAEALVLEGPTPALIDDVCQAYGFAMGPLAMMDLVGLDVLGRDSAQRTLMGDLVAMGRLGQKTRAGYYDYDENRRASPSPVAQHAIEAFARDYGVAPQVYTRAEILARLLYPVVNEGAKLLEEGIALRASDIDVAMIAGYGWPAQTGGPMFWANTIGLPTIVADLRKLEQRHGSTFAPSPLLTRFAASGEDFDDS